VYHVVRRVWHCVVGGVDDDDGNVEAEVDVEAQGVWRVL
jgi:hypothetical protein